MATEAPLGDWVSPVTTELITGKSIRLGAARAGPDGLVYWLEGRPTEAGRSVLVRRNAAGAIEDVTPEASSGFNVRTRVHEYGGGEYVLGKDAVYFSNFKDQRLYKQSLGKTLSAPDAITPADAGLRYADAVVDEKRNRLIAVQEDHSGKGEAVNTVASVDLQTGKATVLASGKDFYSNPRLSADGARLAFVCWSHPNMPWDDTFLYVADVASDGSLSNERQVAGGKDESTLQPVWLSDNTLIFISDRSGWWNLYKDQGPGKEPWHILQVPAEFGSPSWVFGIQNYAALPDGRLVADYSDPSSAGSELIIIDPATGETVGVKSPYSSFGSLSVAGGKLVTVGGSPTRPSEVAVLDFKSDIATAGSEQWTSLKRAIDVDIDVGYLSAPEAVEFLTENGNTAFMNFYAPKNKDYKLPDGHKAPLLVKIHGGPTSQASTGFNLAWQFWTSRGYSVADVNYGGSTGYGREYRNRLRGSWGIVDVDDCCNAARHLAQQGKVDPKRLCITGGSAGGYTTLAALAFKDVFRAGASHYGVADCELLAQETHKFESRYLDLLIGPYPQDKKTYEQRSPIRSIDGFTDPIIFFQGTEDEVVPPNQAEVMYEAIKKKGVPTALVMFEGEQHGFRGSNAIRRALEGELYFYGAVLGFNAPMSEDLESFNIANLK